MAEMGEDAAAVADVEVIRLHEMGMIVKNLVQHDIK